MLICLIVRTARCDAYVHTVARCSNLIFLELALDPDAELEPDVELEKQVRQVLDNPDKEDDGERRARLLGSRERQRDKDVAKVLDPQTCTCAPLKSATQAAHSTSTTMQWLRD